MSESLSPSIDLAAALSLLTDEQAKDPAFVFVLIWEQARDIVEVVRHIGILMGVEMTRKQVRAFAADLVGQGVNLKRMSI